MALQVVLLALLSALVLVEGASYDDMISCDEFPDVTNYSKEGLEAEARSRGQCIPYLPSDRPNPCNKFFAVGVDNIYLPFGRARNSLDILNDVVEDANIVFDLLRPQCREPAIRALCYYFYPPCGNATHFEPPSAVCEDVCLYLTVDLCPDEWMQALEHISGLSGLLNAVQIQFINCSAPGLPLGSLPHCCSDAGIKIVDIETTVDTPTTSTELPQTSLTTIVGSVIGVLAAVIIVGTSIVAVIVLLVWKMRTGITVQITDEIHEKQTFPVTSGLKESSAQLGTVRYIPAVSGVGGENTLRVPDRARVNSGFVRNMSQLKLLIPGRHIKLLDTIGQGEFGVVYRGHLTGWEERTTAELVAVKTLKSTISRKDVEDLIKESEKMQKFDHLHVLSLIGVCVDAGEAPYIIMPYMANGSLLAYLKKERPHLTVAKEAGEDMIADIKRKLLSICLQISQGMCYLAEQKFVHRDLAARNCMISQDFVIKVADFGLSEDVYCRNYFRQAQASEEDKAVKLPIKWMALESLLDGVFTEKTDVWSYGVTCWEVFSLGHTPYPGVDPFSLIKFLRDGGRLEKPLNAACTDQVYELLSQCWMESPDGRNSFKKISDALNSLLEDVAGYVDFSAICSPNYMASGYDHLPTNSDHLKSEETD